MTCLPGIDQPRLGECNRRLSLNPAARRRRDQKRRDSRVVQDRREAAAITSPGSQRCGERERVDEGEVDHVRKRAIQPAADRATKDRAMRHPTPSSSTLSSNIVRHSSVEEPLELELCQPWSPLPDHRAHRRCHRQEAAMMIRLAICDRRRDPAIRSAGWAMRCAAVSTARPELGPSACSISWTTAVGDAPWVTRTL